MKETKFNNYEIMYIVDDQNPEKTNSLKKEFVEILTKNNGKLTKEEDFIGQFAYKINHKTKGHYFVLQLTTSAQNIADFNRIFHIKQKQGDVIRALVVNLDSEKINTFKELPKRPEYSNNREHGHSVNREHHRELRHIDKRDAAVKVEVKPTEPKTIRTTEEKIKKEPELKSSSEKPKSKVEEK